MVNNEIGIAQTNFNPQGSKVVEFASMGAKIPGAVTATAPNGVLQTETGIPRAGQPTVTGDGVVTGAEATSTSGLEAAWGFTHNAAGRSAPLGWASFAALGLWTGIMVFGGGMLTLA